MHIVIRGFLFKHVFFATIISFQSLATMFSFPMQLANLFDLMHVTIGKEDGRAVGYIHIIYQYFIEHVSIY